MKAIVLALMIGFSPCFTGFAHAADTTNTAGRAEFFHAVDDLPLMPGMKEITEESVVFDQPDGRVVQVGARAGNGVTGAQVAAFYAETLPQLGWQAEGTAGFVREKERLTIEYGAVMGGPLPVRFTIKPR